MSRPAVALVLGIVLTAALGCQAPQDQPADRTAFEPPTLDLPDDPADGYQPLAGYEAMTIPEDNALTPARAALGWQLYFDYRLSGDGTRSCYHCHQNELGLSDGRPTALGAFDKQLSRNAPTMWNVGFHSEWYWDGRASSLEGQAAAAWKGGNMGASEPQTIVDLLNAIDGYRKQFQAAYGEDATVDNIPKALASYMRTIIGGNTAWDRWQAGDETAVDEAAKRGYALFQESGCAECHSGLLFTDLQYHNVGVGMDAEQPDVGRYKVTELEQNMGAFKTPTLRDVTRSGPYFHNGSVSDLEAAVRLMASGGLPNQWLDAKLADKQLSDEQIADLMAFLGSLTEETVLPEPELP